MEEIIVGVGDAASAVAVDWSISRAQRSPSSVRLVRAFDVLTSDAVDNQQVLDETRRHVETAVPTATVRTELTMKAVPDALVDAAQDADLLVIGSHRKRPIQSTLRGSVPLRVAARSRCATVIVPDDWTGAAMPRVVVGVDAAHTSDRALLFAAREAETADAELVLVHAWSIPPRGVDEDDRPDDERRARAHHEEVLSHAVNRVVDEAPRVRVHTVLEERLPESALAEHGAGARLIVIGSHRWGPLTGLVLGSTARALQSLTSTPICIVPPPLPEEALAPEEPSAATVH